MTATETIDRVAGRTEGTRLTTAGVLRSEWIKLATLRSTIWCLAIIVILSAGLPPLISLGLGTSGDLGGGADSGYYSWAMATTLPVGFSVLVAAVLGSLAITGEYGTGMIRSTMAAVPRRIPALLAKAVVIGAVVLVTGLVGLGLGAAASGAVLGAAGYTIDASDSRIWISWIAAAGYPALVAVFALGVGAMIRSTAGTVAAVLGLLLVVPTIFQILGGLLQADWAFDVGNLLPSSLGSAMYSPDPGFGMPALGTIALEPWQAALALAGWVVVALGAGTALVRRRDV